MSIQPISSLTRQNIRHLYLDIFWYGVLAGSSMAFLAVYAARLGASNFQISLLTAGPAFFNLLFSLPMGQWLQGNNLIRASYRSAALHRFGYLLLIPLPLIFTPQLEVWALVLITLVMSIPGTALAIAFNAMFAEVIPPDLRAEVVGRRNALVAVALTVTSLACGQVLVRISFPVNYQIVFVIGALGAALSTYHLGRIRTPAETDLRSPSPAAQVAPTPKSKSSQPSNWFANIRNLRTVLRLDLLRGSFGAFIFSYLLFYAFQYFAVPLYPPAYVRLLNLSDSAISLGNALFYSATILISLRLGWLSARFGNRWLMVTGAFATGIYPLLISLAQDDKLYWVASVIGGLTWGVIGAASINLLMDKVPEADRSAYMAIHNLVLNLGILAGSLSGPLIAEWIGLEPTLLLVSVLRAGAAILLLFLV